MAARPHYDILVVTDIDGTLISGKTGDFPRDLPERLASHNIVFAFNTTGPLEVSLIIARTLGFPGDATIHIIESGAAIYSPIPMSRYDRIEHGMYVMELARPHPDIPEPEIPGCTYERMTRMKPARVSSILGYDEPIAAAATRRVYTEAFLSQNRECLYKAWRHYHSMGYYAHLGRRLLAVGPVPGKEKALRELLSNSPRLRPSRLICLGDMDMDVPFLRLCDFPVLVKPRTRERPWPAWHLVTPEPPPSGWAKAVEEITYYGILR